MEEDGSLVLNLFDLFWFRHHVLQPPPSLPPPLPQDLFQTSQLQPSSRAPLLLRRHRRSLSDESAPAPSASLSIHPPKLCTILSGKDAPAEDLIAHAEPVVPDDSGGEVRGYGRGRQRGGRRRRKREEKSKSLTDLEFEELKGFMDLGFTFSDGEDVDPRLLEIVPGLQRLGGNKAEAEEAEPAAVSRPYLSEAWEVEEAKAEEKLRIPAVRSGVDLKDQLRCWVHAVASAVR